MEMRLEAGREPVLGFGSAGVIKNFCYDKL